MSQIDRSAMGICLGRATAAFLACLLALLLALALAGCSDDKNVNLDQPAQVIAIANAWAPARPPGSSTAAVYFEIANASDSADRLIGASTEAAAQVEIHQHTYRDGMMVMERLPAVAVPSGEAVTFEPQGLHLMLFDLNQALEPDDSIAMVLEFEKAGDVKFEATVKDIRP